MTPKGFINPSSSLTPRAFMGEFGRPLDLLTVLEHTLCSNYRAGAFRVSPVFLSIPIALIRPLPAGITLSRHATFVCRLTEGFFTLFSGNATPFLISKK